jgi:hypothetical protein
MKTRVKLLLAGAILLVAMLQSTPVRAQCLAFPIIAQNEAMCEQYCTGSDCWSHYFDGFACYCS